MTVVIYNQLAILYQFLTGTGEKKQNRSVYMQISVFKDLLMDKIFRNFLFICCFINKYYTESSVKAEKILFNTF